MMTSTYTDKSLLIHRCSADRRPSQSRAAFVWAALGPDGKEGRHLSWMRGVYVSTQSIKEPADFVISREGGIAQEKIWVSGFLMSLDFFCGG